MSERKPWRLVDRLMVGIIAGAIVGALPALPIMLITSFTEDKPALWAWPFFATIGGIAAFVSTYTEPRR